MQATPPATVVFQLATPAREPIDWASAWPDALAFVAGLAVARWAGWSAGDLIWSLWLSSFVVGYATIVWMIGQPAIVLTALTWRAGKSPVNKQGNLIGFTAAIFLGVAFLLAFFTVHFGMFHSVHASFLTTWFPLDAPGIAGSELRGRELYLEVLRRYWIFLPSAFLSHRAVFMRRPLTLDAERWAKSLFENNKQSGGFLLSPYVNVMRLHVLIFFFAFAHWAQLDNFAVYTAIYCAYFFPWRLVRGRNSMKAVTGS
jgi:hypothetical protein